MRHEDQMRSVHYTCDSCGETIKRPGHEHRGEHDHPDINLMIGDMTACLRLDLCPSCLVNIVKAIPTTLAWRNQKIRGDDPNSRSFGDALASLKPWNRIA